MNLQQVIPVAVLMMATVKFAPMVPEYFKMCSIGKDQIAWSSWDYGGVLQPGFHVKVPIFEEYFVINRVDSVRGFQVAVPETDGEHVRVFRVKPFSIEVENDRFAVSTFKLDASADDGGVLRFADAGRITKYFVEHVENKMWQTAATEESEVSDIIIEKLHRMGYKVRGAIPIASEHIHRIAYLHAHREQ
jgi:hypothetical protein